MGWRPIILSMIAALATAPAAAGNCVSIDKAKESAKAHNGEWTDLSPNEWEFLRGIYAMNPLTPPGLPYGDRAALVKVSGQEGALIFFIDDDQACTPMPVPPTLLAMMADVKSGKISHEGSGL